MGAAVITLAVIALVAAVILGIAQRRLPPGQDDLVDQVDALLPQTQCAQCGYPGCRPYAEAIIADTAGINLCPPGGNDTVRRLARLLGKEPVPVAQPATKAVAVIDEAACIGCFHCRNACPVDAIVGAPQYLHTVIADECTGCELCVAPCPVDCITMRPIP